MRARQRIADTFLAKLGNWSQMRFARNRRFERDLLTTLTISTMSLNGGEHDARYTRERISLRFARLWETGSRVRHRRVQCTLRVEEASTLFLASRQRARPFRYKFRWNSSLSHPGINDGEHLDRVFPLYSSFCSCLSYRAAFLWRSLSAYRNLERDRQ